MQELNKRAEDQRQRLVESRRFSHQRVLNFAAKMFNMLRAAGRHAHIEHPRFAKSWKTKAFSRLRA
eukprot:2275749-Prorocentrum_lima.AAC.1